MIYCLFLYKYQVHNTLPPQRRGASITQVPPLAHIGSVVLWRVNRNIVVSGAEEKKKLRKKCLFGSTWCAATLWNRTVAWSVAGQRAPAAAGVGVYIENNRGGCFDTRRSAAVCFGLCQFWTWSPKHTAAKQPQNCNQNCLIACFSSLVWCGKNGSQCRKWEYGSMSKKKRKNMIWRSDDYRQDLTNQIWLRKFLVGYTPSDKLNLIITNLILPCVSCGVQISSQKVPCSVQK